MSRASLVLLAAAAAAGGALAQGGQQFGATDGRFAWSGHVVRNEESQLVTWAWAGTSVSFSVTAATVVAMTVSSGWTVSATGLLHVYVDGYHAANVSLGNHARPTPITLVSGLQPAAPAHNITIVSVTDPITLDWPYLAPNGHWTAWSFGTDSGYISAASPALPGRRIDIYGDSITAGNQIDSVTCAPDWSGTYGKQLCDSFAANCTVAAISGKGLYENCCDANATMATLSLLALPGDASSGLTPAQWAAYGAPQGVLINLGTNDWNHNNGTAWEAAFVAAYVAFVRGLVALHAPAPAPAFFLGVGPITHAYDGAVNATIAQLAAGGVAAYRLLFTTPVDRCGHPDYASHTLMYAQARPTMAAVLGWD